MTNIIDFGLCHFVLLTVFNL